MATAMAEGPEAGPASPAEVEPRLEATTGSTRSALTCSSRPATERAPTPDTDAPRS